MTEKISISRLLKVGSGMYARIPPAVLARVGWKRRDMLVAVPGPGYVMLKRVNMARLAAPPRRRRDVENDGGPPK